MTAKTVASRKAKGRNAAKALREALLEAIPHLEPGDIAVTPSGVTGPDLYLSPKAQKALPFTFEVKNQEKLNFWDAIKQSEGHPTDDKKPVLVFKRNNQPLRVLISLELFLSLVVVMVPELEQNL